MVDAILDDHEKKIMLCMHASVKLPKFRIQDSILLEYKLKLFFVESKQHTQIKY